MCLLVLLSLNKLTQSASYRSLLKLKYRCITIRGLGFRIGANQGVTTPLNPKKVKMGLKIMGFNGAKLNFMFENFPLTTIIN